MNQFLFWNGIFSLLLALGLGLLAIYLGFNAFKVLNRGIDEEFELRNNNVAVALVSGSFIFSLGILMRSVIDPITIFNLTHKYEQFGVSATEVMSTFGIISAQFFIALLLSLATLSIGTRLYMALNRQTNELQEIASNNVAVALMVSAITLTLALFLAGGWKPSSARLCQRRPCSTKTYPLIRPARREMMPLKEQVRMLDKSVLKKPDPCDELVFKAIHRAEDG